MSPLLLVGAIVITLVAVASGILFRRLLRAGFEYRGGRIVKCPETGRSAGVAIDAWHAVTTALTGHPEVPLKGCSRWPGAAPCGQSCLTQIVAAPRACTIQNILRQWYKSKCCLWCGAPVGPVHWTSVHPVLLTNGQLKQWGEVPIDQLPEVLTAAEPVCFSCYAREIAVRSTARADIVS